jgi:membrane protease YdiL (CAAX protease family)
MDPYEPASRPDAASQPDIAPQPDIASRPESIFPPPHTVEPPDPAAGIEAGPRRPPGPGGWTYLDVFFFVLFAIPAYVLAVAVCFAVFRLFDAVPTGQFLTCAPLVVAVQLVWWILLLGFIYGVISIKYRLPFGPAIGWRALNRPPTVYLLWGILLAVSVGVFSHWLPPSTEKMPIEELIRDRSSLILLALFGVLLAPAIEELVFRGFLYAAIERSHGSLSAVLVTSAIFSLPHASQYGWRWQNLLLLTYVGIIFGAVRARTQSVVPSTLLHTGYNATLFAGLFAAGDQVFRS